MTMKRNNRLLILVIALAMAALPAFAQDKGPKTTFSLSIGGQGGTGLNESSKLQEYEVIKRGLILLNAAFQWQGANGRYLRFQGSNFGQDDQSASMVWGKESSWKLNLSLDQNPRWFSNTGASLYSQNAPGEFRLPDGMRDTLQRIWSPWRGTGSTEPAAPTNSNDNRFWSYRDYLSGAQPVDLRYVRKTAKASFDFIALKDWNFTVSLQRESRNGTQPFVFTGTGGPGLVEIAQPIDYTTDELRAALDFTRGRFFADGSFSFSKFTNDVPFSTVDNPQMLQNVLYYWNPAVQANYVTGSNTMRLWNAPDNKALNLDLSAGLTLPLRHTITLTFQTGRMSMDRALIPQSTNPLLATSATAPDPNFSLIPEYRSINAKFDTQLVMFNVSGQPLRNFGYSGYYRSYELKDKMEEYIFRSTVSRDGSGSYSATGLSTGLSGYKQDALKGEVHFTPLRGVKLGLNAGRKKTSYDDREYLDITDTSLGVTLDANYKWAGFRGAYSNVKRTPGAFNPDGPETYVRPYTLADDGTTKVYDLGNQPGFFMTDLTKRTGNFYNAALTLTPLNNFAATFFYQGLDNDYPDTDVGLKTMEMSNLGLDLVWTLSQRVSLNGGLIAEKYNMDSNFWYSPQNGAPSSTTLINPEDRYWNFIENKAYTYQLGFRWDIIPDRLDFASDFDYSKGRSNSSFFVVAGGVLGGDINFPTNTTTVNFPSVGPYTGYPEVNNATTIWKTRLSYRVSTNITLGFLWWMQKYDSANYALDNLGLYMQPGSSLYARNADGTLNTEVVNNIYPLLDPSANKALLLGAMVPNYNANIFRGWISYRW
jgi:MtrB/PioB family decaheme-associated outer membrane protein